MAQYLYVEIVSPERSLFRGEAVSFRAPGVEGGFEVLRNHAPMLAAVGTGPVYITPPNGEPIAFAVSGGFVEVLDNRVILLAESADPVSEIDLDRAREAEESARARLREGMSEEERVLAEEALERARNRARLAMGQVGTRR
jgi:F-type H+-transporting ATPase subunit epsilon